MPAKYLIDSDSNGELKEALETVLTSFTDELGAETVAALRPILLTNYAKGRVHKFTEGNPAKIGNYIHKVAGIYLKYHDYLVKVQVDQDESVWEELFLKIQKYAQSYFIRKSFNPTQVKNELAFGQDSEAVLVIFKAQFPYDTDFDAWVKVIVQYCCLKYMRSLYANNDSIPNIEDLENTISKMVREKNEEEKQVDKEEYSALCEAISKLKGQRKKIIVLRYIKNLSLEEIAEKLGKSMQAVYSLHFRALNDLRKILGE
jgi:RNA polymerase sigma factor (sigma-70 family)